MARGPVVIVEPRPEAATVAVGAWVRGGSAQEPREVEGITHLIEHLLLRRTAHRSPEQVSELIDSLGGGVDAFTTRETCAITAHVPAERFDEALELLLDAIYDPEFLPEDLEVERGVIAAEFEMVQDSPAEMAAENALLACWDGHPLARPVLGRRQVVRRLRTKDLSRFHHQRFTADELVLVAVGPVDQVAIERRVAKLPVGAWRPRAMAAPGWRPGVAVEEREGLEQLYVNLVFPGLPAEHPEIVTLGVLQQLLGEGNSSRLFRDLRDRLGLVYDVGTASFCTSLAGVLEVTFSCPARQATPTWDAVLRVLRDVGTGAIGAHEVALARDALTAGVVLGAEGTDALMDAHAGEFLARGRRFDAGELKREIAAVTVERVRDLARSLVRLDALAGAVCGPRGAALTPANVPRRAA
jgi:predicted Zn-dependent peptidase